MLLIMKQNKERKKVQSAVFAHPVYWYTERFVSCFNRLSTVQS